MKRLSEFFAFARERHQIYRRRSEGIEGPWTTDPILQDYRFTNVFRELDKTTVWFRENVREPLRDDRRVLIATIAFRWFNRIETGEILAGQPRPEVPAGLNNLFLEWNSEYARNRLAQSRDPWVTGAYIIKTPNGMNKLDGVLWCVDQCAADIDRLYREMSATSLQSAWKSLKEMPYMGPFMAYEVVTDLRHTHMLENADDIDLWANPGPGARRGLSRLLGLDKDTFKSEDPDRCNILMRKILGRSRDPKNWPPFWGRWSMREVEHTLCEWDKYDRVKQGEGKPKQRFP
ncbi:gp19 [Alphaproteobacteria phage PhiJL001]|uniref:Gp19 n=1 Tax=Alphaproteobacteria phage PhiJL001 TaxID=2681607 RepID=Q5DN86_9CAUD|nr:gp19 [Alphaproteobacteria phage PhiJL001]AAT69495.1 gp19 [Alphaproteobacteria phage PhiJL001]